MASKDGTQDAPATGQGRWLDQRLVVEPELIRLDYEFGMKDGRGLGGTTLIWIHADSQLAEVSAVGTTILSN